jgi:uncharacterized membrane protein
MRRAFVLADAAPADDRTGARLAMAGLSLAGMVETGYLTATKLAGTAPALCSDGGACKAVLEGPWSSIAGVPLAALGLALYSAIFVSAAVLLLPAAAPATRRADGLSEAVLQLGSTAAAVFSALLMILLATTIHAPCLLCIASATISASLFAVAWNGRVVADRGSAATLSAASAAVTLAMALGAFTLISSSSASALASAADETGPFLPPAVETHSSPAARALSQRLRAADARMFGAYWCSHCFDQKQALGIEALARLPYVECARDGANTQAQLCRQLDVPGYPTWQIGGRLYAGEKSIEDLARLLDDPVFAKEKEYVPGQKKK